MTQNNNTVPIETRKFAERIGMACPVASIVSPVWACGICHRDIYESTDDGTGLCKRCQDYVRGV